MSTTKWKKMLPVVLTAALSVPGAAEAAPSAASTLLRPNTHGKSLTTPVAWGAYGNVVFAGVGGTWDAPYSSEADGAALLGAGFGNPEKGIGIHAALVSLDLDEWEEYSMNIHAFRQLNECTAIGAGVESVMLTEGGDAEESFYLVGSHQATKNLHLSIGVGSNRFGEKSDADVADGHDRYGSYVFGSVAYELFDEFNAIVDWNGLNLNAGVSKTFHVENIPLAVTVGAADLTDNSGDEVRFIFGLGTGFKI